MHIIEANSRSVGLETPRSLWNAKVHFCAHRRPRLDPVVNQMNQVYTLTSLSLRSILIVSSHPCLRLSNGLFFQVIRPKFCVRFPFVPPFSRIPFTCSSYRHSSASFLVISVPSLTYLSKYLTKYDTRIIKN